MSVDLSNQCKYAFLAVAYLAKQKPDRLVPIREIGDNVNVPRPFLAKILATLSRNGVVKTRRGPNGGVMLARPPGQVRLGEVVRIVDGPLENGRCYLGLPQCDDRNPCPVHATWRRVRDELDRSMHERTLDDLKRVRRPKRRKRKRRR